MCIKTTICDFQRVRSFVLGKDRILAENKNLELCGFESYMSLVAFELLVKIYSL